MCLIDVEQGSFRSGRVCVDQIFTLKQMGEKDRVYVDFMDLERRTIGLIGKLYDRC